MADKEKLEKKYAGRWFYEAVEGRLQFIIGGMIIAILVFLLVKAEEIVSVYIKANLYSIQNITPIYDVGTIYQFTGENFDSLTITDGVEKGGCHSDQVKAFVPGKFNSMISIQLYHNPFSNKDVVIQTPKNKIIKVAVDSPNVPSMCLTSSRDRVTLKDTETWLESGSQNILIFVTGMVNDVEVSGRFEVSTVYAYVLAFFAVSLLVLFWIVSKAYTRMGKAFYEIERTFEKVAVVEQVNDRQDANIKSIGALAESIRKVNETQNESIDGIRSANEGQNNSIVDIGRTVKSLEDAQSETKGYISEIYDFLLYGADLRDSKNQSSQIIDHEFLGAAAEEAGGVGRENFSTSSIAKEIFGKKGSRKFKVD